MKKSLQVVIALVALGAVFGCAIVSLGQGRRILGGYKVVDKDDSEVQAAAEAAVSEQNKKQDDPLTLVSIEHAERQVVAGMNYRLCLKVQANNEDDDDAEPQEVKVEIFRSLKNEYSLKSWEVADCGEAKPNQ